MEFSPKNAFFSHISEKDLLGNNCSISEIGVLAATALYQIGVLVTTVLYQIYVLVTTALYQIGVLVTTALYQR